MLTLNYRSYGRQILDAITIFAIYFSLAIVTTWPLAINLRTHLPGGSSDTFIHYWNHWWVQQAIWTDQTIFYTTNIFYPEGVSLITHNFPWSNIVPWLVLEPIIGGYPAYNIAILLNLSLCGCFAYLLAYRLTKNNKAAFLAGLIYQAWPFRISQLDHPNLLATQFVPLFFLFLILTLQERRWRDAILTGIFFALIGFTRWQQLIPAAIMAATYLLSRWPDWVYKGMRPVMIRLLVAGLVAFLLLSPPLFLLFNEQFSNQDSAELLLDRDEAIMQTDMLAYLTPAGSHPMFGDQTQVLYDQYYPDRSSSRRFPVYIGFVALVLSLVSLIKFKQFPVLVWFVMAVVLISLAAGPLLRINGRLYEEMPTLYRLLSPLYFVRLIRIPDRFNMFLSLPFSLLAAYGLLAIFALRNLGIKGQTILTVTLSGLILFEYLSVPVLLHDVSSLPTYYAHMRDEAGDFAVVNIPFDVLNAKEYMFYQAQHGRPISQGKVTRMPDGVYDYIEGNPWLNRLLLSNKAPFDFKDISRQLNILAEDNIRYIIIHKSFTSAEIVEMWRRYLAIIPRFEDEQVVIYTTLPEAGSDFIIGNELIPGFGLIDVQVPECVTLQRPFEIDAIWGSSVAVQDDLDLHVSMVDNQGQTVQAEQHPVSTLAWPTSRWPRNTVTRGEYMMKVQPTVAAGDYEIYLFAIEVETGEESLPVLAGSVSVEKGYVCNFATKPNATDVNAMFGEQISLVEYEIEPDEQNLSLTLYWRADIDIETDYKFFVHAFDPVTDIPVAQYDGMPREWTYPTSFWRQGEFVDDFVTIPLADLPPGRYGLGIGIYDPDTGDRLPLVDFQGSTIEDGRLVLDDVVEIK